ncbi:MAG: hypothetical protein HYX68_02490 [Planctomycetes bacterium]|jgi:aspartokinase-like uncharacterized kinase|nr:hypothetical protein [Planctomycetota bacterium]
MRSNTYTVVKVGGSLYQLPDLRDRLRAFLTTLPAGSVLLVPGGGAAADAIRALDRIHQLGEETSHWLAIQALSLNAAFLQSLLPEAHLVEGRENSANFFAPKLAILDALPFFRADEARPDHLPHRWEVTSDSLAVRAAVLCEARELILLKSTDGSGADWATTNQPGVVDAYFAEAVAQVPRGLSVRVVNLRSQPIR